MCCKDQILTDRNRAPTQHNGHHLTFLSPFTATPKSSYTFNTHRCMKYWLLLFYPQEINAQLLYFYSGSSNIWDPLFGFC